MTKFSNTNAEVRGHPDGSTARFGAGGRLGGGGQLAGRPREARFAHDFSGLTLEAVARRHRSRQLRVVRVLLLAGH